MFPLAVSSNSDVSSIMIPANKSSATGTIRFTETYVDKSITTPSDYVLRLMNSATYTPNSTVDEVSVRVVDGSSLSEISISNPVVSVREGQSYDVSVVIAPQLTADIKLNFRLSTGEESVYRASLPSNVTELAISSEPQECRGRFL